MEGPPLAARIRAEVAEEVARAREARAGDPAGGGRPRLDDLPEAQAQEAAKEAGIDSEDRKLPEADFGGGAARRSWPTCSMRTTQWTESSSSCPFRRTSTRARAIRESARSRMSTACTPSTRASSTSDGRRMVPATPLGIMALLAEHRVHLEGAKAVVVGRSDIVGKPAAHTLAAGERDRDDLSLAETADLSASHARGRRIGGRRSAGRGRDRRHGEAGIRSRRRRDQPDRRRNRRRRRPRTSADLAAFLTRVPGGVGPMTIAMLLQNTVKAARYRRGLLAFPGARAKVRPLQM